MIIEKDDLKAAVIVLCTTLVFVFYNTLLIGG